MKGLVLVCLLCAIPFFATAHSEGVSLERTVGEYWIDIGYDPAQLSGGDRVSFDFELADSAATSTLVAFDYVWVRLQSADGTLLASGIHRATVGPTTLVITIPKDTKGDMNLSVRFQRGDDTLAQSDFTIPVAAYKELKWRLPLFIAVLAGAAAGSCIVFMWKRRTHASDIIGA